MKNSPKASSSNGGHRFHSALISGPLHETHDLKNLDLLNDFGNESPTNNWIVLFHPQKMPSQQPRALFHCSSGICLKFQSKYVNLLVQEKGFFIHGRWHDTSRHFCEIFIIHLQYLVPTPFNLTCQVTSESLGFLYLGKHLFAKSSGQIITENGKVYPHLYTHVFYRKFPVDFFVCLQGTTPPNKLLETHNSPPSRNAISDRTAHPEIHDGHGTKVVNWFLWPGASN